MITFEDVTKFYPGQERAALRNVNLEIEKGEFVFLVGQSGSGKSTFLRLILREYRPTKGTLYVAGKNLTTMNQWKVPQLRRQIGTVFQDFRLLPGKTVYENVAFALQVIGTPAKQIKRIVEISGCSVPQKLALLLDRYENDNEAMAEAGADYAAAQIRNLWDRGASGIHVYTMNKAARVLDILKRCGMSTKAERSAAR